MSFGLFNTKTTYQIDYVQHSIASTKIASRPKFTTDDNAEIQSPNRMKQIDIETMKNFQPSVYVPFNVYFRPKECVTTNPFVKVDYKKKDESNKFAEKLEARRIRPRVYMIPQISLDDVDEDMMYRKKGLVDNLYTSDWKIATEFTKNVFKKSDSDAPPTYEAVQVGYKPNEFCTPIEPGMQKYGKEWDRYQLRAQLDPKGMFWKNNPNLATCTVCSPKVEEKLSDGEVAEIDNCLAEDNLRLPYQLSMPGYCGYVPNVATNIKPRRAEFKRTDPWLSTLMLAQMSQKRHSRTSYN